MVYLILLEIKTRTKIAKKNNSIIQFIDWRLRKFLGVGVVLSIVLDLRHQNYFKCAVIAVIAICDEPVNARSESVDLVLHRARVNASKAKLKRLQKHGL